MKKQLVITTPNPILSEVSKPVTSFDNDLKKQAKSLLDTLKTADYGIGLAAIQIGLKKAIFVVEYEDPKGKETIPLTYFVNPQIANYSDEKETMEEGCLSVPGIFLDVLRSNKIKIKAQNLSGKKFKLTAKGLLARLIQHETDHLNGKIFTQLAKEQLQQKFPDLKKLKIVFIGTGEFAEALLRGLILLGLNITIIITEKSKPSGRNQIFCPSPVALTANIFKKPFTETEKIEEQKNEIQNQSPDLIILADFGQKIAKDILDVPNIMAINLHPSLLPKYRGATPIQTAILKGEKETGVSIIKMSPEIDKGDILAQQAIDISQTDNAFLLRDRLANLALNMLLIILPKLQKGKAEILKQDDLKAFYTHKFSKNDGLINWKNSSKKIDRQIRALFGWPGSFTTIDNKRLVIHQAHLDDDKLILDIVQLEGKSPVCWQDFLRGYHGEKPAWFKKVKFEN